MLFAGEGLFLATLRGPGRVWLETMPLSSLAAKIARYTPSRGVAKQSLSECKWKDWLKRSLIYPHYENRVATLRETPLRSQSVDNLFAEAVLQRCQALFLFYTGGEDCEGLLICIQCSLRAHRQDRVGAVVAEIVDFQDREIIIG